MAYFGRLIVDNESYLVGSTLFGVCNTAAGTSAKLVTTGIIGSSFDQLIEGITVNIQFIQGITVDTITLRIGQTRSLPVQGNCKCNANSVLSFTYNTVNGIEMWILNVGEKTALNVMQTYDSTSTDPISGVGVAEALAPLTGGNNASAYGVDTEIGANPSTNRLPTSSAVANYVNNAFSEKDALVYKGTIGIGGTITSLPYQNYSAGWVYRVITAGTYANQKCEVNDLLMSIQDADNNAFGIVVSHWVVIQTNIVNPVSGPNSATSGHVATFGANNQEITDSGYTIATSVPSGAVFTDTHYEDKGTEQVVTGISDGTEFTLASIVSGTLNIKGGLNLTTATVSTGIQEVT